MAQELGSVKDLPNEAQMAQLIKVLEGIEGELGASSPGVLDASFAALLDGTNTTAIFKSWYSYAKTSEEDKYKLLVRFGEMLEASTDATYTLRYYDESVSSATDMTPMDDLAEKTKPKLYTESMTQEVEWLDEDPMTWYIRANAVSLSDGTMNVLAIEDCDANFDKSGLLGPVQVFALALYVKRWNDGEYNYISFRTKPGTGYEKLAEAIAPDGSRRVLTWHPAYPGGLDEKGGLTSGSGRAPYIYAAATTGLTKARITSPYEGLWGDPDTEWALLTWQLRHWNIENSNIAEGCMNFNYQYKVAAAEEGVRRVLVTQAQGKNFIVGCTVAIGDPGSATSHDRSNANMHDIASCVRVDSIEDVTVGGTVYTALNLEMDSEITTTETTYVSAMPWFSGTTDAIKGHKDGATISLTSGKTPIRIAGVEFMHGAYDIGLDPLYSVTVNADDDTKVDYAIYECRDSVNLSGSITSNYKDTGITGTFTKSQWTYVKSFVPNKKGVVFPEEVGGSSTGWMKSAFYASASAGVRCPFRFGNLNNGGNAGLACENGSNTPGWSNWNSRPRISFANNNARADPCESRNQVIQEPMRRGEPRGMYSGRLCM